VSPAELIDAFADPAAEARYRDRLAAEAYERGRATGAAEEHERQLADEASRRREMAALTPGARRGSRFVSNAETDRCRWVVRGEQRTRQTFGRPHPDDFVSDALDVAGQPEHWEARDTASPGPAS